jgi:molecular chaperone DnaJ
MWTRRRQTNTAMTSEFYVILGIGQSATVGDIKKAYRKLARRYHPDINPGDRAAEELFKRIAEAYEVLSDPDKRGFYDKNGYYVEGVLEPPTASRWDFEFGGFDSSRSSASGFGDLFSQFFQDGRTGRREEAAGIDLECQISLTFKESITGVRTRVSVYRKRSCEVCEGAGRSAGASDSACGSCGGSGQLIKAKGHLRFAMTCPGCEGTGRVRVVCSTCRGDGRVARSDEIEVDIPPGVSTGSRIRCPGKGDAGRPMRPPGDLYVVTNVAAHPFFKRVGDNIHCAVPITVTEAALGAKIEIPTIDGRARLRIPPRTQSGQTFRLRGKGAPSLRAEGVRGDQYVEVQLVIPRIADERSKEILRELDRLNPDEVRKDLDQYGQ